MIPLSTAADTTALSSYADFKIKAVYIYRFANFIRWPGKQPSSIQYCALGNDNVALALSQLIAKAKPAKASTFVNLTSIDQSEGCHILYITQKKQLNIRKIPTQHGMLTVGGDLGFIGSGGMIELRSIKSRIKPVVALEHVKNGQLTISSKLLRIAVLYPEQNGGANE